MSSRAYKLTHSVLNSRSRKRASFNYTHSDLELLLSAVRNDSEMPFDNGGMGMPIVIYRFELEKMEELVKGDTVKTQWGTSDQLLQKIRKDMDEPYKIKGYDAGTFKRDYVLYYLV